jgi:hypothetical protein
MDQEKDNSKNLPNKEEEKKDVKTTEPLKVRPEFTTSDIKKLKFNKDNMEDIK